MRFLLVGARQCSSRCSWEVPSVCCGRRGRAQHVQRCVGGGLCDYPMQLAGHGRNFGWFLKKSKESDCDCSPCIIHEANTARLLPSPSNSVGEKVHPAAATNRRNQRASAGKQSSHCNLSSLTQQAGHQVLQLCQWSRTLTNFTP